MRALNYSSAWVALALAQCGHIIYADLEVEPVLQLVTSESPLVVAIGTIIRQDVESTSS